jgi:hypothetical protein
VDPQSKPLVSDCEKECPLYHLCIGQNSPFIQASIFCLKYGHKFAQNLCGWSGDDILKNDENSREYLKHQMEELEMFKNEYYRRLKRGKFN